MAQSLHQDIIWGDGGQRPHTSPRSGEYSTQPMWSSSFGSRHQLHGSLFGAGCFLLGETVGDVLSGGTLRSAPSSPGIFGIVIRLLLCFVCLSTHSRLEEFVYLYGPSTPHVHTHGLWQIQKNLDDWLLFFFPSCLFTLFFFKYDWNFCIRLLCFLWRAGVTIYLIFWQWR